ncbi:unnamed protein product [Cochlearia groenlandica]
MHVKRICEEIKKNKKKKKKGHLHHHHRRLHELMFRSPSRVTASFEASSISSSPPISSSSSTSFSKDGRIVSVGDCALFKPPQDCPPFIGLIRSVIPEKEGKLKLRVNWLYRPSELKLGRGIHLESQPNEIFYSFHEDEILAASLLHPCKVTFLPRGVALPSGISSFVCWRVYDVMNESIWWLTDQDYTDERQHEVDKLLCKTRSEMNTTLQQDGRSSRSMNSPTTSQVKAGIDSKSRKRERGDQSSESVKRERLSGCGFIRTESSLKPEIAKITEKGGLVDPAGVERLVQLMLPERSEKKIDMVCRSILAGVVAATDKFDCLSRFVQLRGLPVFDEWLQDIHKGKIGDNDRSVDDFLLILLRALDKLPVNLNALQACNIGKSVNHLRSHKNLEIGRKARSLVDTWKKRVEAEMDAKSRSNQGVSWPGIGKSRTSEISHGGKHSGVSADAAKASASHPSKSVSVKVLPENSVKSASTSPSSTRSAPSPGTGAPFVNDGQQRNTGALHRSFSSQRISISEKLSQSILPPEKTLDVLVSEGCSNKLIVKLPNRGRSPIQRVSGGSFEDHAASSNSAPSPIPSDKLDQFERNVKEINDTCRANFGPDANTETSQNSDLKLRSTVSDEVACSPFVHAGDEHGGAVNDSSKVAEIVKPTSPTSGDDFKTEQRHGGLHSSMDALIESCARDSETNACLAGADDVGMNLLATVAADEMSNTNAESQTTRITDSLNGLPCGEAEPVCQDEKHVSNCDEHLAALENVKDSKPADLDENSDSELEELQRLVDQCLESNENSDDDVPTTGIGENMSGDSDNQQVVRKTDVVLSQNANSEAAEHSHSHSGNSKKEEKSKVILSSELGNKIGESVSVLSELTKDISTANVDRLVTEIMTDVNVSGVNDDKDDRISDIAERVETSVPTECKAIVVSPKVDSLAVESLPSDVAGDNKKEQKPKAVFCSKLVKKIGEDILVTEKNIDSEVNDINHTDKEKNKCLDSSTNKGEVETLARHVLSTNGLRVSIADTDEAEECISVVGHVPSVSASEMEKRVVFDLNEGLVGDDSQNGYSNNLSGSLSLTPTPLQPSRLPPSITITAAAKGAFVPRDNLLRNKATVGWRGSAATSAFRPAEPRKVSSSDASTTAVKQVKTFLDFDLNVPDDRVLEDLATNSSGCGLDLDLNKVDDPTDMNSNTITHRVGSSFQQPNLSSGSRRDFDLNDGPSVDDMNVEPSLSFSQHSRGSMTSQPMIRMNGENMAGGFSSWFSMANNYSAMSNPQVLPERGGDPFPVITSNGPQRIIGPASFAPDMYRGPVLLSSPAVSSYPATSFQYPGFPFGTSFPLASANYQGGSSPYVDSSSSNRLCFPPVNSQIMGQGVAMPSNYPRPYVVNLPNGNGSGNSGVSDNKEAKWFRSGLDLNSGPGGGGHETEEAQRQLLSSSSSSSAYGLLPLRNDEARMYQMSGGVLKRKEPDGGWDGYKQSSWQ